MSGIGRIGESDFLELSCGDSRHPLVANVVLRVFLSDGRDADGEERTLVGEISCDDGNLGVQTLLGKRLQ